VAAAAAEHRELRKSAVYRGLTTESEQTRRRTILNCRQQSIHLNAELPSLLGASRRHIKAAETENNIRTSTTQLLYLLGSLHEPEVESLLISALDSPLLGIRLIATDILDGQLHHLIDTALKSATVSDFLGDEERFREWQARQTPKENKENKDPKDEAGEDKIVFKTAGYESESQNRIQFGKPQYYGIDIHSQRMMFIIDHSGSMEDYWGGMTRLARAKLELIKVIRELPEETEFAIMFYETNVRIWRKSLVTATESNKLEAINFVRRLGFGDRTNTHGALRQALTFDKDLETVFLLTDGQPTIGETVEPQKILVDILGRNRFRHLNFNTIGIAVNPNTEAFLRQLATGTGGEYRRAL